MSAAQVLNVPVGTVTVAHTQLTTILDGFGYTVLDLTNDGTTVVKAATLIDVDAPTVTLPAATFTNGGVDLDRLNVTGATTMTTVDATSMTASGSVTTPLLTVGDPETDALEIVAASVVVRGDLEVDGTIGTQGVAELKVKNKVVSLGVTDPTDLTDTSRDAAGIVVPGVPENLPADKTVANYEHSIRWQRKYGDFSAQGETMAPHQKPRWTFSGGCVSIAGGDASEWFIAPHTNPANGEASLGIYFQTLGSGARLVQRFVSTTI